MPALVLKSEVEDIVKRELSAYNSSVNTKLFLITVLVGGLGFGAGYMTCHWRQVRRSFKSTVQRWAVDCSNFL